MSSELAAIAALPSADARTLQYAAFLSRATASPPDAALLSALADHFSAPTTPVAAAYPLFAGFADALPRLPPAPRKALAARALDALGARASSFEAEVIKTRLALADACEADGEWAEAARALAGIPFDGVSRVVTDEFRARHFARIARFFVEDDNTADAERWCMRAAMVMHHCTDPGVALMHNVSSARMLDAKRKFEDASMKYYQLSQMAPGRYGDAEVTEADAAQALNFAVTCAILAPAGPRRSRVLAILYNDERSRDLPVYPMLDSIHTGCLLTPEQVEAFRPTLRPHQVALDADGATVLDRAVTEHNLLAASQSYTNITFEALGALLGVTKEKAEEVCQTMAYEGRMHARLDQVEGVVEFEAADTRNELARWDSQIEGICASVDACSDAILKKYPQLASK